MAQSSSHEVELSDSDESDDSIDIVVPVATQIPDQSSSSYGVGASLLAQMGYESGSALGTGAGQTENNRPPLEPERREFKDSGSALDPASFKTTPAPNQAPKPDSAPLLTLNDINEQRKALLLSQQARIHTELAAVRKDQQTVRSISQHLDLAKDNPNDIDLDEFYALYGEQWDEFGLYDVAAWLINTRIDTHRWDSAEGLAALENAAFMLPSEVSTALLSQTWLPKFENGLQAAGWNADLSAHLVYMLMDHYEVLGPVRAQITGMVVQKLLQTDSEGQVDMMIDWFGAILDPSIAKRTANDYFDAQTKSLGPDNSELVARITRWVPFVGQMPNLLDHQEAWISTSSLDTASISQYLPLWGDWYHILGHEAMAQVCAQFLAAWVRILVPKLKDLPASGPDILESLDLICRWMPQEIEPNPVVRQGVSFIASVLTLALDAGTRDFDLPRLPPLDLKRTKPPQNMETVSTFREVVQHAAAAHDLVFSDTGTTVDGHRQFTLAGPVKSTSFYIEDDVAWLSARHPISLTGLLASVRKPPSQRRE